MEKLAKYVNKIQKFNFLAKIYIYFSYLKAILVDLLEELNSLSELLSRSVSLTIPEMVSCSLSDGVVYSYNEMKHKLRHRHCSAFQFQFASNLVFILREIKVQKINKIVCFKILDLFNALFLTGTTDIL